MTEIEKTEGEIKVLQAKLELLKEMEKHKSPVEEAYKDWWGEYPPTSPDADRRDIARWHGFQAGYYASQEPKKEQKWDVVRESVKWCKEHKNESVEDYLKPQGPQGPVGPGPGPKGVIVGYEPTSQEPEENKWKTVALRFGETLSSIGPCGYYEMTADEWLEWANDTYEKNADELLPLVKRGIRKNEVKEYQPTPPEPTSTVFRQKLFDGIKSVFYDPDYERTHWKMKVNMAVDEVLTHFYDVIPEEQSAAGSQNVDVEFLVDGYNDCLNEIKSKLR